MVFSGKGDNLREGPEPGDDIAYVGSCQQFSSVGVWPLVDVSGQMTKCLRSWTEAFRVCQ